jgi:beta-glucanase (GH16 family)
MPLKTVIRAAAAASVLISTNGIVCAASQAKRFPKHRFSNRLALRPAGITGRWRLVLNSEFTGPRLPAHWHTGWLGSGVTAPVNRSELACYSPANVTFPRDGTMHLNVTSQESSCGGETRPYTGAMVTTDPGLGSAAAASSTGFEYTYGVLEASVYIPAAGARIADWPAVWADGQNWPVDGEDDLMEGIDGTACFHFHDPLGHRGGCDHKLTPGWHTFASNWRPGSVTYYYDGRTVGTVATGVTSEPMYVLLDNTVSPRGAKVTSRASMRVRYVRVWQHS